MKMNYSDIKFMKDDYLKFIKFIASDILQLLPVKIVISAVFISWVGINLFMIYYVLYVTTPRQFNDYSPVFFGISYPLLSILIVLFKDKLIHNLKNEIKIWAIDTVGENTHSKIKRQIKMLNLFVICNTFLLATAVILSIKPLPDDMKLIFALRFIHEYFPNHETVLTILFIATYPVAAYMVIVHAYQILYCTQHTNFQIQLFNKVLADVDFWERNLRETELFDNKSYQKQVEHKLKFCIQRFQEFVKLHLVKTKQIDILVAAFAICGVLIGIGISIYIFSGDLISSVGNLGPEYYLRISAITLVGTTTFSAIIWGGQSVEIHLAEMLTTLNQVRWYNFNQTNKKLYLILLTNMMKERKIRFTENYSINFQLGLAIVRGIYSVASVAVKMRS